MFFGINVARGGGLTPAVQVDTTTATMLGRVSRSAIYRLVMLEGLKVLERRYRRDATH